MITVLLLKGAPASLKTTWAKKEIATDPQNYIRVNNDDLRQSFNGSVFGSDYEKMITETRLFLIKEGLKRNLNVIADNVNANKRHWEDCVKICKEANKEILLTEKLFYEDLEVLLERNAKREGIDRVPDEVVIKFWKQLGGTQFKSYQAKKEIFTKRDVPYDRFVEPIKFDNTLQKAAIFDNDGTIARPINSEGKKRNPYNAETADEDTPILHTIEAMRLYYKAGYKIIFVSGREEKDRAPTERFYKKHFPDIEQYELYMRPTGNSDKDVIIKERIYKEHIEGKYRVAAWFDDRLQIMEWLYNSGFPCFRVGDPHSSF